MIEKILLAIKAFFDQPHFNLWLQNHLLYFAGVGLAFALVLMIIIIYRTNKDISKMEKEKRKRDKAILKFLSNKKNKTY